MYNQISRVHVHVHVVGYYMLPRLSICMNHDKHMLQSSPDPNEPVVGEGDMEGPIGLPTEQRSHNATRVVQCMAEDAVAHST